MFAYSKTLKIWKKQDKAHKEGDYLLGDAYCPTIGNCMTFHCNTGFSYIQGVLGWDQIVEAFECQAKLPVYNGEIRNILMRIWWQDSGVEGHKLTLSYKNFKVTTKCSLTK